MVALGIGPLVGRAFLGMCLEAAVLRKSWNNVSADQWECVPTQFFVWPEVSQHWRLQAFRWGWVFVPKYQVLEEAPQVSVFQYVHQQCLCPQDGPHPPPASPEDTPKIRSGFDSGYYPVTAFALGPYAPEILCALFKSEVSYFFQSCGGFAVKFHWLPRPKSSFLFILFFSSGAVISKQECWSGLPHFV